MRPCDTPGGRRARLLICTGVLALSTGLANADEMTCGPLKNAFGPFDSRVAETADKAIVEGRHFTRKVERLQGGETGLLGHDLDYTLRAFPNHPRALMSMSRLAIRDRQPQPPGANYPIDCYFDRAFRFVPDDPWPLVLYGLHLERAGRDSEAPGYLDKAARLGSKDPNVNYNLGLGYLDLKQYEKALAHAKLAYAAGFPLPGLRDRLKQVGAWKE